MTKYIIGLIVGLAITLNSLAQEPMIINGTITTNSQPFVSLYKVVNGRIEQIAQTEIVNNKFAFKFYPSYSGFYVIGNINNPTIGNYHIIYGKEKEILTMNLEGLNYDLVGKNSKENKDLANYQKLLRELKNGTKSNAFNTFDKFFPIVEKINSERHAFKADSKDKIFIEKFKILQDNLFDFYAISYRYQPQTKHPHENDIIPYYKSIDQKKYLNSNLLYLPFGDAFMLNLITDAYVNKKFSIHKDSTYIEQVINYIPDDIIKGQFLIQYTKNAKSYDEFIRSVQPNEKYIKLEDQKNRLNNKLTELAGSKPGNDFIDFSFSDVTGRKYSKKDFNNKVIIIDFWATWCGPCKQEEPYFEDLATEFQDREIAFLAISTDKNKNAWEEYIKPKQTHFKGIHLHAGNENILSKAYKINTIPRYMVIDKKGKIVSINSPRPSNPDLKRMILELL